MSRYPTIICDHEFLHVTLDDANFSLQRGIIHELRGQDGHLLHVLHVGCYVYDEDDANLGRSQGHGHI